MNDIAIGIYGGKAPLTSDEINDLVKWEQQERERERKHGHEVDALVADGTEPIEALVILLKELDYIEERRVIIGERIDEFLLMSLLDDIEEADLPDDEAVALIVSVLLPGEPPLSPEESAMLVALAESKSEALATLEAVAVCC